jgi:hypothetical protein
MTRTLVGEGQVRLRWPGERPGKALQAHRPDDEGAGAKLESGAPFFVLDPLFPRLAAQLGKLGGGE